MAFPLAEWLTPIDVTRFRQRKCGCCVSQGRSAVLTPGSKDKVHASLFAGTGHPLGEGVTFHTLRCTLGGAHDRACSDPT